jgi:hypothetical protein
MKYAGINGKRYLVRLYPRGIWGKRKKIMYLTPHKNRG